MVPKGPPKWSKWSQKVPKSGPNGAKSGQSVAKSAPTKRQTEPRTPNIPKPPASQIESLRDGRERAERQGAAVFPRREVNPPPLGLPSAGVSDGARVIPSLCVLPPIFFRLWIRVALLRRFRTPPNPSKVPQEACAFRRADYFCLT